MNKNEFLSQLRQSLNGEVDADVIEQNIRYYDQYIDRSSDGDESRVLGELGDPRLIAKTIIESERIAKQKENYSGNPYESSESYREDDPDWERKWEQENSRGPFKAFWTRLKWYQKLAAILVVIVLIVVLVLLGRFLVGFMFTVGFPLILILLVLMLFRNRRR